MLMSDIQVKEIGELIKVTTIEVTGLEDFFQKAKDENWILEDILDEWSIIEKDILLLPMKTFKSQLLMVQDHMPIPIIFQNTEVDEEFLFLKKEEVLPTSKIRNAVELSGEGKLITSYDLKFKDFNRYLRVKEDSFFGIEPDQIILNQVRLIQDSDTPTLGIKLTGKAAEIAAKRKELNES